MTKEKTSMYLFEENYIKKEMANVEHFFNEINSDTIKKIYNRKIKISDNPQLQKSIDSIDNEHPIASYEQFIYDVIHNTLPRNYVSKKPLMIECYITKKLLEIGMISSLYNFEIKSNIMKEIEKLTLEKRLLQLIHTFRYSEKQHEMIRLFVDYEFRGANFKGKNDYEELKDAKDRIEFYYKVELYQQEMNKKREELIEKLKYYSEDGLAWRVLDYMKTNEYRILLNEIREYKKLGFIDEIIPHEELEEILYEVNIPELKLLSLKLNRK